MAETEQKVFLTDEQFAQMQEIERAKSGELLRNVTRQTALLLEKEAQRLEDIRDMFAANALSGIGTWMPMPDQGIPSLTTEASLRARAEWAYRQADAMIAARKAGAA